MSDVLKNVERTMFTLNYNNIVETCFNKTINFEERNHGRKLSEEENIMFDNCIDKYISSFHIVKDSSLDHIAKLINR